jgi:formate-dependent phosphoribosylglycinamide formyltransferase (GAR transformylase)
MQAEVWERNAHDPTQVRNFSHGVHSITLNIRPILGLPAGAVLPVGCPATVVINLARVRNRVMAVPL